MKRVLRTAGVVLGSCASGSVCLAQGAGPPEVAKLIASDAEWSDGFGWSVAVSGTTAVVGAIRDDHSGLDRAGSAYVFDLGPSVHVLSVGVDEPLGLVGSVNAGRVADAFSSAGDRLQDFETIVYPVVEIDTADNAAARQQLFDAIDTVRDVVRPGDSVVVYIDAHGYYGGGNDEPSVLAEIVPPPDCDLSPAGCPVGQACFGCPLDSAEDEYLILDHGGSVGVTDDELRTAFSGAAFEEVNKLFIIDACFAGGYWGDPASEDSGDLNLPLSAVIAASGEENHSIAGGDLAAVASGGLYTGLLGRAVADGLASIPDGSAVSGSLFVGAFDLAYSDLRQNLIVSGNPTYIQGDPAYWGVPLDNFEGPESITVRSSPDFGAFGDGPLDQPATPCVADLASPFGVVDLTDVDAFIAAFLIGDPVADLALNFGIVDLQDVDEFIDLFLAGCP